MVDAERSSGTPWPAVAWTMSLVVLTSVGLVALAWFLVTMEVLVAIGLALVAPPDGERAPVVADIGGGHGTALALALVVNLVSAATIALVARRTPVGSWPAWVTGCVAAGVAFLVAGSVLLLALGISPVDVVAGLWAHR